jgi:hypothetical protein
MKKLAFIFAGLILIGCKTGPSETVAPVVKNEETSAAITYEGHIQKLVKYNCIGCHRGAYPKANLNLETYNSVKLAAEKGALLDRINDSEHPMPIRGLMSVDERKQFLLWAKNGYPLNTDSIPSND